MGRVSSFFSTCTGFLHQGAPTPNHKTPIPRHLGSAARSSPTGGRSEGAHRLPRSSFFACLGGQRRQGFHTSHSFVSGGEGTRERKRRSRGWEGKETEDGDRKVETKMKADREPDCLSACGCAHSGTALQARCKCFLPPVASPGNLRDFLGRSWIPEHIV